MRYDKHPNQIMEQQSTGSDGVKFQIFMARVRGTVTLCLTMQPEWFISATVDMG